jgi:DNA polymerase III gamma/tau subunit
MSKHANERRLTHAAIAMRQLGCRADARCEKVIPLGDIARLAHIPYEEAHSAVKTLVSRGWFKKNLYGRKSFYRMSKSVPIWLEKGWRRIMPQIAEPTHYDAMIAASYKAEEAGKELMKLIKQVREPKGTTAHATAEDALRWKDTLEQHLEVMTGHAEKHSGIESKGDLVDQANKAAVAKKAEEEAAAAKKAAEEAEAAKKAAEEAEAAKKAEEEAAAKKAKKRKPAPEPEPDPREKLPAYGPLGIEFQPEVIDVTPETDDEDAESEGGESETSQEA